MQSSTTVSTAIPVPPQNKAPVSIGTWLEAARPKTLTAALSPILVGTALARAVGFAPKWQLSVLALLSTLFIQIGCNLFNDALDFHKGHGRRETRRSPSRDPKWTPHPPHGDARGSRELPDRDTARHPAARGGWPGDSRHRNRVAPLRLSLYGGAIPARVRGLGRSFCGAVLRAHRRDGDFFISTPDSFLTNALSSPAFRSACSRR